MNYNVGTTPNYNAPVVDFAGFFGNNKPQQLQPQQQQQNVQQGGTFMDKLKQFLNGQQGQRLVGQPNDTPVIGNQGRGDY